MKWLLPFFYLRLLDIFDVAEENTAHINILRFLVVVLAVRTMSLLLPFLVAVVWARSLHSFRSTEPQAAQIAWLGSWLKGLPQIHLSPSRETSIIYPRLKSSKIPSPRDLLTLTALVLGYGWGCNGFAHAFRSRRGRFVPCRCGNGPVRLLQVLCNAVFRGDGGGCILG